MDSLFDAIDATTAAAAAALAKLGATSIVPQVGKSSEQDAGGGDGGGKGGGDCGGGPAGVPASGGVIAKAGASESGAKPAAGAAGAAAGASEADGAWVSLKELVRVNHHLLNGIGVGHPALDKIVSISADFGLASKLTGAGGGGCAFTLLEPGSTSLASRSAAAESSPAARRPLRRSLKTPLETSLEAEGFECFDSAIAGPGVQLESYLGQS